MKLLKLEILNLASLDRPGGETVNFEEGALGDSTIFSIVGPTGSGKSTILDAICLALYNRAPRYPKKKGDRNRNIEIYGDPEEGEKNRLAPTDARNILTRGKKEGYSKLTFLANNGSVYRAEWYVRFQQKNYAAPQMFLYKLSTGEGVLKEELCEWEQLPEIIGLDYDQFLRTVLIAQGSFANFLTASEDERYALLEKLVGCEDLYITIAEQIKNKKDEAENAYASLAASFSAQENDVIKDEEELKKLNDRIAELEKEASARQTELAKVNEALGWYSKEEGLEKNLEKYKTKLEEARLKLEEIKEEVERLKLHDVTLPAVDCYKAIRESEKKIEVQTGNIKTLFEEIAKKSGAIEEEKKKLDELNAAVKKAVDEFNEKKPHINKARTVKGELESALKVLEEKGRGQETAKKNLDAASLAVESNAKAIDKAEKQLGIAKEAYDNLKSDMEKGVKELSKKADEARAGFEKEESKIKDVDAQALQKAFSVALQKKNDIAKAIDIRGNIDTKKAGIETANKTIEGLIGDNAEMDKKLSVLDYKTLQKEVETLQNTRTLMTSEDWNLHRTGLEDGKPCPLCGAVHHPFINDEALNPVINDLDELICKKKTEIKNHEDLSIQKGSNEVLIKAKKDIVGNLESGLKQLNDDWSLIYSSYPDWPEEVEKLKALQNSIGLEVDASNKALTSYNNQVKLVGELRTKKESAEKALHKCQEQSVELLKEAEQKKTDADTTLATEKGRTDNLKAQLEEKSKAFDNAKSALEQAENDVAGKKALIKSEIGDEDPDSLEKRLNQAKTDAEGSVNKKKEELVSLANEKTGLEGRVKTTEENRQNETLQKQEKSQELEKWLSSYNSSPDHSDKLTMDLIEKVYRMTDNWEDIRRKQNELRTLVTSAQTTYDNEMNAQKEHSKSKPESEKEQLETRKSELENVTDDELIELNTRKKRHEDATAKLGDMLPKKQEAELLRNEWKEITDSIGVDGKVLRKIAQCYTLRFLVEHANAEIAKFNSRYQLQQVKNSLGIRVIDHDRADDVRDTTSLSGGETFIVSLGLALGLSSLSSRNISFENLFIDEGFGTLDPDTLGTVIDSLAMLQTSQGKKVGVISHTDTMSERITTQIRIIKNGNSGSSHIEIYP